MDSVSGKRKTGIVFYLGMFLIPLVVSLEGYTEEIRISVAGIEDIDRMDLPVKETLLSWLETEFTGVGDIIIDSLEGTFPLEMDAVPSIVTAGRSNGSDIVIFGEYRDSGTKVQMDLVSVITAVGAQSNPTVLMSLDGEDRLGIAQVTPGSPAPDIIRFYLNLIVAELMGNMGEFDKTGILLDTALQFRDTAPTDHQAIAWTFKGDLNLLQERYEPAIEAYTEALELFPEDEYLLSFRATCYDALGERESALDDLLRLADISPDNAATIGQLGAEFYQNGQYEDALLYLDHAVALDPSNAMAFRDRARVFFQIGDYEQALSDLDEALLLEPGSSQGLSFRGIVLHLNGDQEAAIDDLSAAIELERNLEVQAWSYYARANCHISLGDHEAALADLTASLDCSGSSYTVLYLMGVCFMELGEPDLATAYLTEYLSFPIEITPMDPWTTEDLHEKAERLLEELDQS